MSTRTHCRARGFSLIEMMLATAISLVALAGALAVGAQLQRRSLFEEQTMVTQNAARAARDMLVSDLHRAGGLAGTLEFTVGADGGAVEDTRQAIRVIPPAALALDPTYAPPPAGAYAARASDAFEIWSTDASTAMSLRLCTSDAAKGGFMGSGGGPYSLCLKSSVPNTSPSALKHHLEGQSVLVANHAAGKGCAMKVDGVVNNGHLTLLQVTPSLTGASPPAASDCLTPASAFWRQEDATKAVVLTSVAYRVNWKTGRPVLEYDPDGSLGGAPYAPISNEIEQITMRRGVAPLTTAAAMPSTPDGGGYAQLTWFPDPSAGYPDIEQCSDACKAYVPGPYDGGNVVTALRSRVRMVELVVTARSPRADTESIRAVAGGYALDENGNPQDGYKRRTFTMSVAPRNFALENLQ